VAGVQNCLCGKTFLALEGSATSQNRAKKFYASSQTSAFKRNRNLANGCESPEKNYIQQSQAKSWNAGVPFKIISSATDGVSQPQAKAETQVYATQMQSNVTCTCCWIVGAWNSSLCQWWQTYHQGRQNTNCIVISLIQKLLYPMVEVDVM